MKREEERDGAILCESGQRVKRKKEEDTFSVFQWEEVLKLEEPTRVTVSSSSFLQTFSNSPLRR